MIFDPRGLEWMEYTGEKLTLYEGSPGNRSKIIKVCVASSGKPSFQDKKHQLLQNMGPTPEGKYTVDLRPDPNREAKSELRGIDDPILKGGEGIEKIPEDEILRDIWGDWRMRLKLKPGEKKNKRNNMYLHNSNAGSTSGCIDTCDELLAEVKKYRDSGAAEIEVWVNYTDPTTGGHYKDPSFYQPGIDIEPISPEIDVPVRLPELPGIEDT